MSRESTDRPPATVRRPSVCFVTVDFQGMPGSSGTGEGNAALALALAAAGFEVTVAIANSDESGPRMRAGTFDQLKSTLGRQGVILDYVRPHPKIAGSFDDPRTASYCVYLYLRGSGFDVVLFNDLGGLGFYSLLARRTGAFPGAPTLCVVGSGPVDWVHESSALEYRSRTALVQSHMERRSAGLADILISHSRSLLDWMHGKGWLPHGGGLVINSLVRDDSADTSDASPPRAVAEIVFLGPADTRKGLGLFCDALDALDRNADLSTVRVTFLGGFGRVGAMHSGIFVAERARRWHASPRILTVYDQSERRDYLRRPGVLAVIPSRGEHADHGVTECLLLGVPFLAADCGGTAELLAPEDRERCLFDAESGALAGRLETVLRQGHARARMAVPPADTLSQWIDVLSPPYPAEESRPAVHPGADGDAPLISVCLAASGSAQFAACLQAVRGQDYARLEIIVAAEEAVRGGEPHAGAQFPAAIVLHGAWGSVGAARNAAAARARGRYLLFTDETAATLLPGAIAALARAATHSGADILTGLRDIDGGQRVPKPPGREWELPLGACVELGAVENCFGAGALLVRAAFFAASSGFAQDGRGEGLDWLFLAGAALDGAVLEVVPVQLLKLREAASVIDDGERAVEDHRRILRRYGKERFETVARLAETFLELRRHDLPTMQRALQGFGAPARELAVRLASMDPGSVEASRLFVQYCCERRMIELALDFALHNDVPFLPQSVTLMTRANEAAALDFVRARRFDVRHDLDLTRELQLRAKPFYGLQAADLQRPPGGSLEQLAPLGDSVVKIAGACPPGTTAVRLTALTDSACDLKFAGVLCRSWSRPSLTTDGVVTDDAAWWSGWVAAAGPGVSASIELAPPATFAELLDLYLIVRRENAGPGTPVTVVWTGITASVFLVGDITPSAIDMAVAAIPLPPELLDRGELLTDVSDTPFKVYIPGSRSLLHPLPDRLSLVRIAGAIPRGSRGLRCAVSIEQEKSHPIEFGAWARPASAAAATAEELDVNGCFSGWIRVDVPFVKRDLTLLFPDGAADEMDLYLATRVVGHSDTYWCHAYWHDLATIADLNHHEEPRSGPAVVELADAAARRTRPDQSNRKMRRAYLICTAARAGGGLLAAALRETRVAGAPFDYFNADAMNDEALLRKFAIPPGTLDPAGLAARLDPILRAGTTDNGTFAALVQWSDLDRLIGVFSIRQGRNLTRRGAAPDGLRAVLPSLQYVWLRRENKVAQAISHYVAATTGDWQRPADDSGRLHAPVAAAAYDFAAIQEYVAAAEAAEAGWRDFLSDSQACTLDLSYEELAADYRGTVARVLAFLGLGAEDIAIAPPAFSRLADERSAQWERRYREEDRALADSGGARSA